jgi:two-component system chemotaxis sensor kinase CheA
MNQMTDREAVNLIFAPGFSTAEVVSDLSGRGVGMDVVRSAVEAIQGAVSIESTPGAGTSIRISLPLSMAVSEVMVVQSDGQLFGVPMDHVLETVRIPRRSIRTIKRAQTAILRGRIVPLKSLNAALGIAAETLGNLDDELCILLVQTGGELLGLLVDGFRETMAIIQKPLTGILSGLASFTGSTLLGDGSVLLILNIRELF